MANPLALNSPIETIVPDDMGSIRTAKCPPSLAHDYHPRRMAPKHSSISPNAARWIAGSPNDSVDLVRPTLLGPYCNSHSAVSRRRANFISFRKLGISRAPVSEMGQTLHFCDVRVMSALPPIVTKSRTSRHFGFRPALDSRAATSSGRHSISSSARSRNDPGMVRPIALAVFTLIN